MYCPEVHIFEASPITLWFQASCDVPRHRVPKREWWNPLRYWLCIRVGRRVIVINRDGHWNVIVANAIYRLKARIGLVEKFP